jgi:hypothetical protein
MFFGTPLLKLLVVQLLLLQKCIIACFKYIKKIFPSYILFRCETFPCGGILYIIIIFVLNRKKNYSKGKVQFVAMHKNTHSFIAFPPAISRILNFKVHRKKQKFLAVVIFGQ